MTLDLVLDRDGPLPKEAATVALVRDTERGLEVFCVERSRGSRFLGGAIVFPGGKVDPADRDAASREPNVADLDGGARCVAACRELFEEAAILLATQGTLDDAGLEALRSDMKKGASFASLLAARGLALDLEALRPLARWVTPKAEQRRYDTWFFVAKAPDGQSGAHDAFETVSSFWTTPGSLLARFDRAEVQLAPPTHRTLEILATAKTTADAFLLAESASKLPICPELVAHDGTMALVLPGDPLHSIREARVVGRSRFVLRDGRFLPEDGHHFPSE